MTQKPLATWYLGPFCTAHAAVAEPTASVPLRLPPNLLCPAAFAASIPGAVICPSDGMFWYTGDPREGRVCLICFSSTAYVEAPMC